jgi:hypothetical protein
VKTSTSCLTDRIHKQPNSYLNLNRNEKGPQLSRSPFPLLLRRVMSSSNCSLLNRDSHRVRGVFSDVALLGPVESCNPPWLLELTASLYALAMWAAREICSYLRAHTSPAHSIN